MSNLLRDERARSSENNEDAERLARLEEEFLEEENPFTSESVRQQLLEEAEYQRSLIRRHW